jgi:lysophospholipase L1-like esterase
VHCRTIPIRFAIVLAIIALALRVFSSMCLAEATTQPLFDLSEGENRIVLVGNGFIEQSRLTGYIEARLLRRFPERSVIIRNLGWSGDSVSGAARTAGYQNPAGLDRLIKETTALKPTIIFVGYGLVESFEGEAALPKFTEDYNALLDALQRITPKLILLSPTFHEDLGPPLKDPSAHNRDLERYTAGIFAIASERKLPFIDLYHPLCEFKRSNPAAHLTSNGITLNDSGYWVVAEQIERQLGLRAEAFKVEGSADGSPFRLQRTLLPAPAVPEDLGKCGIATHDSPQLRVSGLESGQWSLIIDGKEAATADARNWQAGVTLPVDPDRDTADKLRRAIVRSNELFYRRWRPFNDHSRHWTYIGGDFALYDQQLAELDKTIAALRRPASHDCRIIRKEIPEP